MLKLPTTLATVDVVCVPPAITPGMVLNRSPMLRPFSARSRSWVLVTRSDRSADSVWIWSRPASAATVIVSVMAPTSRTKSPTFSRVAVLRTMSRFSTRLKPCSSTTIR